jgi:hypothetical protein
MSALPAHHAAKSVDGAADSIESNRFIQCFADDDSTVNDVWFNVLRLCARPQNRLLCAMAGGREVKFGVANDQLRFQRSNSGRETAHNRLDRPREGDGRSELDG